MELSPLSARMRMHVLSSGLFLLKCDLSYQPLDIEAILKHVQGCIDDEPGKGDDASVEVVNMDYPSLVSRSGSVGHTKLDSACHLTLERLPRRGGELTSPGSLRHHG